MRLSNLLLIFGIFIVIVAMLFNLKITPEPWWDEGWTLNVAHNWIELGHYGQLKLGKAQEPGLSAAFPVVAPIALSFKLFGIGIWQGRLPSVFFLFVSIIMIYYLSARIYNRSIAFGALVVLLFLSGPFQLHPLTMGRTVMAEMPMIFYLLAGYSFLFLAIKNSEWFILLSSLFWGIAIITKGQTLPFWLASLLLPLGVVILKRRWQQAGILLIGLFLSWLVSLGLQNLARLLIPGLNLTNPIPGLIQAVAFVLNPDVRIIAIRVILTIGLPTLAGFLFVAWKSFNIFKEPTDPDSVEITKLALLGFVGSWLAWYLFLALFLDRYLFPAVFVGSIFTSALLYELTFKVNIKRTIKNASGIFFRSRNRYNIAFLIFAPIIILLTMINISYLVSLYRYPGPSIQEVTGHLENITNESDLIETYESELFFLLDRRYHYPPDEIDVEIISKVLIGNEVSYSYNPLEANPDYLVIGEFGRLSKIYDEVIASGEFEYLETFQEYEIYSRID